MTAHLAPGDTMNRSRITNRVLAWTCLTAGVISWLPAVPRTAQVLLALAGVTTGALLMARMRGICRACGHQGRWGDPLTVARRPRVHARHLPAIRASHQASRQAARNAR